MESNWSLGLSYAGLLTVWEIPPQGQRPTLCSADPRFVGDVAAITNARDQFGQLLAVNLPSMGVRENYVFFGLPRFAPHYPYGWTVNSPLPVLPAMRTRLANGRFDRWPPHV